MVAIVIQRLHFSVDIQRIFEYFCSIENDVIEAKKNRKRDRNQVLLNR
jgi:hypothetical protein